jgi:hypothetical protein
MGKIKRLLKRIWLWHLWFIYCRAGYHWPEVDWYACPPGEFEDEIRIAGKSMFMKCDWCHKFQGPICESGVKGKYRDLSG